MNHFGEADETGQSPVSSGRGNVFTRIELLVVIAFIAILAGFFVTYAESSRRTFPVSRVRGVFIVVWQIRPLSGSLRMVNAFRRFGRTSGYSY